MRQGTGLRGPGPSTAFHGLSRPRAARRRDSLLPQRASRPCGHHPLRPGRPARTGKRPPPNSRGVRSGQTGRVRRRTREEGGPSTRGRTVRPQVRTRAQGSGLRGPPSGREGHRQPFSDQGPRPFPARFPPASGPWPASVGSDPGHQLRAGTGTRLRRRAGHSHDGGRGTGAAALAAPRAGLPGVEGPAPPPLGKGSRERGRGSGGGRRHSQVERGCSETLQVRAPPTRPARAGPAPRSGAVSWLVVKRFAVRQSLRGGKGRLRGVGA